MGERTGAEVGGVIHVAGFRALAAFDAATHEVVNLQQIGADLGHGLQVGQDAGHETAGGLHRFDFRWCLQFDHACYLTSRAQHMDAIGILVPLTCSSACGRS